MRCNNCEKMVSLELQEPEEQTTDFEPETGAYSAEYRIVRNCADCGQEMKEATFNFDGVIPEDLAAAHSGEGHMMQADFDASELEEGGGRYAKSYFGVDLDVHITCLCGNLDETIHETDKVAASQMEELG